MAEFTIKLPGSCSFASPEAPALPNATTAPMAKRDEEEKESPPPLSGNPLSLTIPLFPTIPLEEHCSDQFQTRLANYRRLILPAGAAGAETDYSFSQYFMDGTLIKARATVSRNPNFNMQAYDYLRSQSDRAFAILVQAFDSSKSDFSEGAADQLSATDLNPLDVFVGVDRSQFESLFLKKLEEINPAALAAATISPFIDSSDSLTEAQQEKIFTYLLVLILLFTFDDIVADAKIPPQGDATLGTVYSDQTDRVTDFVAKLIDVLFEKTFSGDPVSKDNKRATYLNGKKGAADRYKDTKDFFSEFLTQIMDSITKDMDFKNTIAGQLKDYLNSVVQEAAYQELAISESRPTNERDFKENRRFNGAVLPCLQAALAIAGLRIDSEQKTTFRQNIFLAIDNITMFNDIRSATKEFEKGHEFTNLVGIYRAHSEQSAEQITSDFFQLVAAEAADSKSDFLRKADVHIKTYLITIQSQCRYFDPAKKDEINLLIDGLKQKPFLEIQLDDDVHSFEELENLSHLIRAYQVVYNWMTGHEAWEFCGDRHGKYDITIEKLDALIPLINKEDVVNLHGIGIADSKLKKMVCLLLNYKLGDNPTKDQILADIEIIKAQIT